jgi:hypothetical protein
VSHAPVAIVAHRRPELTARLIRTLQANPESRDTRVYAFCDGARRPEDEALVARTRQVIAAAGLRHLELVERSANLGLAANVIDGVTRLCAEAGRVIALEDDLILSPRFLRYMNDALERYRDEPRVFHVSGFMYPVHHATPHDALFLPFISSWGWGTWSRAWQAFEPGAPRAREVLVDRAVRRRFDLDGCYGFSRMLRRQLAGRSDSWAIRWYLSVFARGGLSVFPRRSLVENDGFEAASVHCRGPRPRHAASAAEDFEVGDYPPVEVDQAAFDAVKAVMAADSSLQARVLRRLRRHVARVAGGLRTAAPRGGTRA